MKEKKQVYYYKQKKKRTLQEMLSEHIKND